MLYKLVITNDATSDLCTLQAYLEDSFGRKAANKVISKIILQLQQLGRYPKLGASASSNQSSTLDTVKLHFKFI